jgi:hypothetical protein
MFVVRISYLSMLYVVAQRCCLPYAHIIREITPDGYTLYGVELQLPSLFIHDMPRSLFFWSSTVLDSTILYEDGSTAPYEDAACQALRCLQSIYSFTVVDYSYSTMVTRQQLFNRVFSVANRGAQLARMVVAMSHNGSPTDLHVLCCAERVLDDLNILMNPTRL